MVTAKRSAAVANNKLGALPEEKKKFIVEASPPARKVMNILLIHMANQIKSYNTVRKGNISLPVEILQDLVQ